MSRDFLCAHTDLQLVRAPYEPASYKKLSLKSFDPGSIKFQLKISFSLFYFFIIHILTSTET